MLFLDIKLSKEHIFFIKSYSKVDHPRYVFFSFNLMGVFIDICSQRKIANLCPVENFALTI